MSSRIFLITPLSGGNPRLMEASGRAAVIRHLVEKDYRIEEASPEDLHAAVKARLPLERIDRGKPPGIAARTPSTLKASGPAGPPRGFADGGLIGPDLEPLSESPPGALQRPSPARVNFAPGIASRRFADATPGTEEPPEPFAPVQAAINAEKAQAARQQAAESREAAQLYGGAVNPANGWDYVSGLAAAGQEAADAAANEAAAADWETEL